MGLGRETLGGEPEGQPECRSATEVKLQPRSQGLFLNWEGNALASAAHMTPRISGCKKMLISEVSVSVCINNKSEK